MVRTTMNWESYKRVVVLWEEMKDVADYQNTFLFEKRKGIKFS